MKPAKPHISVAPMLDWTDRHCRYFHRLLSPHARLYTEMVTTGALLHGDADRHLRCDPAEKYVALQLGGSEAEDLALCAKMGADYGYDEINLNCGCPSERVQKGAFGACLMKEPDMVARCVEAMAKAVNIPVTVKCRIGIDDVEAEPFLRDFIRAVSNAGCGAFIIHARKAWLKGLSPKENRDIPPLDYTLPAKMKAEFPHLHIILNGGIKTVAQIKDFLPRAAPGGAFTGQADDAGCAWYMDGDTPEDGGEDNGTLKNGGEDEDKGASKSAHKDACNDDAHYDGVMIGREAYQNPGILLAIERDIFGNGETLSMEEAVLAMIPYIERQMRDHGTPMKSITRHMTGLFSGQRGSRAWRRALSTEPHHEGAGPHILEQALARLG
ncbi:MAG: tRNA dihydrouridine(20/20a) synthase DusA [Micavibrio sp.]